MPAPARLASWYSACDSRHCTGRQIAVAALGRLRSGLAPPWPLALRREVLKPASGLQHPEQKTGARKLFSPLDCRTHLASAARPRVERRACIPGRRVFDQCSMEMQPCPSRSTIFP